MQRSGEIRLDLATAAERIHSVQPRVRVQSIVGVEATACGEATPIQCDG